MSARQCLQKGAHMESARGCLGGVAMLFFGATVLIGWPMVIFPVLAGESPSVDIGILVAWTVGSLIVMRVAGGPGWGIAPQPNATQPTVTNADTAPRSGTNESLLPGDWSGALARKGLGNSEVQEILTRAYDTWQLGETLPDRQRVFHAFKLTPLHSVKVVVLGQDPYPTRGQADGLAFSVQPGTSAPYSLARVFSNLESDNAASFTRPSGGDLTQWAQNGVLLLNAALTVREHAPGSHSDYWRGFTRGVLEVVNEKIDPVVFLLWGDDAIALADTVRINESKHRVIRSTHPRREESSRYPRFADTRPFSEANQFLRSRGRDEVDWAL